MAMATARWAAARQDMTATAMATGDNDNNDDDDGATTTTTTTTMATVQRATGYDDGGDELLSID